MAQEHQELRSVNWNELFGFTHLFKCFRMAIQPSKLFLSAAVLVVLFLAGWGMDRLWSLWGGYVRPGEIAHHAVSPPAQFDQDMAKQPEQRLEEAVALKIDSFNNRHLLLAYLGCLDQAARAAGTDLARSDLREEFRKALDSHNQEKEKDFKRPTPEEIKKNNPPWHRLLRDAEEQFDLECEKVDDLLKTARQKADTAVKNKTTDKEQARKALDLHLSLAEQAKSQRRLQFASRQQAIRGQGIAEAFTTYEWNCIRGAVAAVWRGQITSGLGAYKDLLDRRESSPPIALDYGAAQVPNLPLGNVNLFQVPPAVPQAGFLVHVLMAYRGVAWLIRAHWVYAIAYLAVAMAVWALLGGAVHRIAALHFARQEKISIAQALRFSAGKFLSFFTAPLIPVAIVLLLGAALALGGVLFGNYLGGIVMAVLFLLALLLGLGIAFLLTGLIAGGGLMYPTIAVEGSDSFDAISRSYSYVFDRPWRSMLYGLVALGYGAITYLFVRVFALVALRCTHFFVKWGVFAGGDRLSPHADKLDVIWATPTFDRLFGPFNWAAMSGTEPAGAFLLGIWVFLVAAVVAGYLLSYGASAATVIYCLLRRKVDASDLDDVYVEEPEEPAEGEAPAEGEPPAESPAPAETPPADETKGENPPS